MVVEISCEEVWREISNYLEGKSARNYALGRLNGTVLPEQRAWLPSVAPIRAGRGASGLSSSWSRSARSNEVKNLAELGS